MRRLDHSRLYQDWIYMSGHYFNRQKGGSSSPRGSWRTLAMYCRLEEPATYMDAMSGNTVKECRQLWRKNWTAKNNTWEVCALSPGQRVIKAKWVFKIKHNREGYPVSYKVRLVAKSFLQQKGIDYPETFASVVRYESIQVILAVVASKNYELSQFDTMIAFLYGELDEEIFMELSKECDSEPGEYCRLLKSLYGLNKLSRNKKFNEFLREYNFESSPADPCIYIEEK